MNINEYVGNQIRKARIKEGVTQENVAKIIDLSRVSVVNLEAGRQTVHLEQLYKFSLYFGKPIKYFFPKKKKSK